MKDQHANPRKRKRLLDGLREAKAARTASRDDWDSKRPEYAIWDAMIQRCTNPNTVSFSHYGGRGISVDPTWRGRGGFKAFFAHVGPRPSDAHTLGRIDNDGDYTPGNVQWETRLAQMKNWGRNRMVTINGEILHISEWARRIGVSTPTLSYRLKAGWSEQNLLKPGRQT